MRHETYYPKTRCPKHKLAFHFPSRELLNVRLDCKAWQEAGNTKLVILSGAWQ